MTTRIASRLTCTALAALVATCSPKGPDTKAAAPLAAAPASGGAPLKLAGSVGIPGYAGDFDHFAIDEAGDRLFLAGEEGKTLEVFKLSTGQRVKTLTTVEVPHSLHWMGDRNELLDVDGGPGGLKVFDGASYAVKRSYKLSAPGADSVRYDLSSKRLFVVTGGKDVPMQVSYLNAIDPATGKLFWKTRFDANHVEALAVEEQGSKIFINVTDKNELDVLDKTTGKILQRWKIKEAEQNAPMAYDEKTHRLFVVTRKPGKLLVLNSETGATVASFAAPARTDEVVWDAANRRAYVVGGEGYVSVIEQDSADHYREAARVPSGPGAKTASVTPKADRLYVAQSPGETKAMGKLLWFDIKPRI